MCVSFYCSKRDTQILLCQSQAATATQQWSNTGWTELPSSISLSTVGAQLIKLFIAAEQSLSDTALDSVCTCVVSPRWLPCQYVLTVDMLCLTALPAVAALSLLGLKGACSSCKECVCVIAATERICERFHLIWFHCCSN